MYSPFKFDSNILTKKYNFVYVAYNKIVVYTNYNVTIYNYFYLEGKDILFLSKLRVGTDKHIVCYR